MLTGMAHMSDLEQSVHANCVYSIKSVSEMKSIISVISYAIYGVVSIQLTHSSFCGRDDMSVLHLQIVIN